MKPVLKIYGLERSGTNYAHKILEQNFDAIVLSNITGWKHHKPYNPPVWDPQKWFMNSPANVAKSLNRIPDGLLDEVKAAIKSRQYYYLFIVRDPATWVSSFIKFRYRHMPRRYSIELLNNLYIRLRVLRKRYISKKPIQYGFVPMARECALMWNEMVACYLEFVGKYPDISMIVHYESLTGDLCGSLDVVRDHFSLHKTTDEYTNFYDALDSSDPDFAEYRVKQNEHQYDFSPLLEGFDFDLYGSLIDKSLYSSVISSES